MSQPILDIQHLDVSFPSQDGSIQILDNVNLSLSEGEALALVGESGSGKSMTALASMRLIPKPGYVSDRTKIMVHGRNILDMSIPELRSIRGKEIAMIFQEPMSSLNPVVTVGKQVVECIRLHEKVSKSTGKKMTIELFEQVGIPDAARRFDAFPHQLSGGLKQRVMIAMAMSLKAKLLIADEPTTALDVTVQRQIIRLMKSLQQTMGTAILFITHDLGLVNQIADKVAVMYAGQAVEYGTREQVLHNPSHPYTKALMGSIPSLTPPGQPLPELAGMVPKPGTWPTGCRFADRCNLCQPQCRDAAIDFQPLKDNHQSRCIRALESSPEATT